MASSRPVIPNRYIPVSAARMKDRIGEAIVRRIERDDITAAEIARRYASIRAGDISKIRQGDWAIFGINRLVAIAEAIGVSVEAQVS
ncbi:XRE family transcriptional regulator [Microvirga calopogonii]|uniref:XRE family transcriptional regulator n=1 Tax=Microvirga calopogonii TaxID=2078013 RepID=UPI000E0DA3EC|nr:XRE family transcriptional regulator [Microvirga calopogonii]